MDAVAWSQLDGAMLSGLFDADALGLDLGDRYDVGEPLGEGGQGMVVQALDRACMRQVAVKCAKRADTHVRAEAELLSRMAHPAIPQVYDLGTTVEGRDYVAMQLVVGRRLDVWLESDPPLEERLRVFLRIADGVEHAHRRNVLHRDLKPSNVVVADDGEPVILDWGLAAHHGKRSICGSPHFAAPEQLESQPVDRRADIYALGVLLYWLLSNELPYARRVSDFQEFRRVRGGIKLLPLRRRAPKAPKALERLVQRCMATHPAARPASAEVLAEAVRSVRDRLRQGDRGYGRLILFVLTFLAGLVLGFVAAIYTEAGAPLTPAAQPPADVDPTADPDTSLLDRLRAVPSMHDSDSLDDQHARDSL